MSSAVPTLTSSSDTSASPPLKKDSDDLIQIHAQISSYWKLGIPHVLVTGFFSLLFMYLSYQPLFHTDLWGHVAYGQWILQHQKLPIEDPYVQQARGVPMIASAWLGQVILAKAHQLGGPEGISALFTAVVWSTYALLALFFYRSSRQLGAAMFGMGVAFFLVWSRHATVRPEMFATLSFVILIGVFCELDRRRRDNDKAGIQSTFLGVQFESSVALIVFLTFLFWANSHGSFLVGSVILGCQTLGSVLDSAWRKRSLVSTLCDWSVHRWLILFELSIIATLINPYGMDQILNALEFSSNPNLPDVLEWKKLEFFHPEGIQMCLSWIMLMFVFRYSRESFSVSDILILGILSFATIKNVRMIGWYGFGFAYVVLPHWAELGRTIGAALASQSWVMTPGFSMRMAHRSHMMSIFCVFLAWCGFALSHAASPILGGETRSKESVYSKETPLGVSRFLRQHPPSRPILNPQWWGDWLAWDGPPGLPVFMTTNAVHLAPQRYWRDYMGLVAARDGWQKMLGKYNIETIVVHKSDQPKLDVEVRNLKDWTLVYEDGLAVIVSRDVTLLESHRTTQKLHSRRSPVLPQRH